MSPARYLSRVRTQDYDCLDFVREVWAGETGRSLGETPKDLRVLRRVRAPVSPCLVVMSGGERTHLGVFLRGSVWHLKRTARCEPLARACADWPRVRFYV